jgi:P-type Ca2+ transporter type 2C
MTTRAAHHLSQQNGRAWHVQSTAETATALASDATRGLSPGEAAERATRFGKNRLAERRREPWWEEVFESLTEPLVLLLVAVGVLYAIFGEIEDAVTIFVVIVAVAGVEVANEMRAKRAIGALRTLSAPSATVLRAGLPVQIATTDLVPGDVVLLQPGDRVPADLRLVEAVALRVDESGLTGESVPVYKEEQAILSLQTELADRRNLAFSGTLVTAGKGRGMVVGTGKDTELGRITGLMASAREPRTPLQQHMRELSGWLVWLALGFSILVPVLGVLVAGRPIQEMLLTGLTLAFATIPEELPILITIVLGIGAYQLAKQNGIVKHLRAAETLGSVSVVGTDKTGTLTENRMRVAEMVVDGTAQPFATTNGLTANRRRLLEIGILASDAQVSQAGGQVHLTGDPTDTALLDAAEASGVGTLGVRRAVHIIEEFPFDNARKCLSVAYEHSEQRWLAVKGAPESVLAACTRIRVDEHTVNLDSDQRQAVHDSAEAMAARGLRVLAFAERFLPPTVPLLGLEVEQDLTFVGLVGLEDPPRPEAPAAIAQMQQAGVRVLMLTGDHPATAREIAGRTGIDASRVVRGRDLEGLSEEAIASLLQEVSVFARITPEHKLRLVRALQAQGKVVAVTGDGVNDAPALREAAIGVAMGRSGTDVAREAADLVLADDNFATVTAAVRSGRTLYANLRKAIRYYLAVKVALVSASLVAVLAQLPVPFEPVQIILMELFMDLGAATTFVVERPEDDLMARPPRDPRQPFMDRTMQAGILAGGLTLAAAVLVTYLWTWSRGYGPEVARTGAFAAWMIGHLALAAHMRQERQPLLRTNLVANRPFLLWAGAVLLVVLLGTNLAPLQARLHLAALPLSVWVIAIGTGLLFPAWWEAWKWTRRLTRGV